MNKNKKMHIVYASDDHYFTYIYVGIKTLVDHNKNVVVHYLQQDVPSEHLDLLYDIGNAAGVEIDIRPFEMPDYFAKLPAFGAASKTTYAKLIFLSIFPDLDRVLYLDPDTIVLGEIDELYFTDFGDNLIAGVWENLPYYQREVVGLSINDPYINGGMVLCNLKKWREENFEQKSIIRLQDTSMNLNYDQGILNELCARRIKVVPPKYNVLAEVFTFKSANKLSKRYGFTNYYSQDEIEEAINNPTIIHFTHFVYGKPMSLLCRHPYAGLFQDIVLASPLRDTLNNDDIDIKAKVRRFMVFHTPFWMLHLYECIMDIRRKKKMMDGKSF